MLRGLATVSFWAADLAAAKEWYAELLGIAPYFERPGYAEFRIGDYRQELGLIDSRYETRAVLDTSTEHWRVSFYVKTAKETNYWKIEALSNQNEGILFRTPAASPSPSMSRSVAKMLGYLIPT